MHKEQVLRAPVCLNTAGQSKITAVNTAGQSIVRVYMLKHRRTAGNAYKTVEPKNRPRPWQLKIAGVCKNTTGQPTGRRSHLWAPPARPVGPLVFLCLDHRPDNRTFRPLDVSPLGRFAHSLDVSPPTVDVLPPSAFQCLLFFRTVECDGWMDRQNCYQFCISVVTSDKNENKK